MRQRGGDAHEKFCISLLRQLADASQTYPKNANIYSISTTVISHESMR